LILDKISTKSELDCRPNGRDWIVNILINANKGLSISYARFVFIVLQDYVLTFKERYARNE